LIEAEIRDSRSLYRDTEVDTDQTSLTPPVLAEGSGRLRDINASRGEDTTQIEQEVERSSLEDFDETYVSASFRAQSCDADSASLYVSTMSPIAGLQDEEVLPDAEALLEAASVLDLRRPADAKVPLGVVGIPQNGDVASERTRAISYCSVRRSHEAPKQEDEDLETIDLNSERRFILLRATSILSISSAGDISADHTVHLEQKPVKEAVTPSSPNPTFFGNSNIIDLCSDDTVVVTPNLIKRTVNPTPDLEATPRPDCLAAENVDKDELRWPSDMKKKRKTSYAHVISDEEDHVDQVYEVDGDAWKRALLRQWQSKGW
jgi:hypothetical protein